MDQIKNATLEQEKEKNSSMQDTEITKETDPQEINKEEYTLSNEEIQAYKTSRQKRVIACLTHLGMLDLIPKK
jgi:peroxiredoxin family protein